MYSTTVGIVQFMSSHFFANSATEGMCINTTSRNCRLCLINVTNCWVEWLQNVLMKCWQQKKFLFWINSNWWGFYWYLNPNGAILPYPHPHFLCIVVLVLSSAIQFKRQYYFHVEAAVVFFNDMCWPEKAILKPPCFFF